MEAKPTTVGAGASGSARGVGAAPMDLDALRYTGSVNSHFHGTVQFDRHPTEGGVVFRRCGSI